MTKNLTAWDAGSRQKGLTLPRGLALIHIYKHLLSTLRKISTILLINYCNMWKSGIFISQLPIHLLSAGAFYNYSEINSYKNTFKTIFIGHFAWYMIGLLWQQRLWRNVTLNLPLNHHNFEPLHHPKILAVWDVWF